MGSGGGGELPGGGTGMPDGGGGFGGGGGFVAGRGLRWRVPVGRLGWWSTFQRWSVWLCTTVFARLRGVVYVPSVNGSL